MRKLRKSNKRGERNEQSHLTQPEDSYLIADSNNMEGLEALEDSNILKSKGNDSYLESQKTENDEAKQNEEQSKTILNHSKVRSNVNSSSLMKADEKNLEKFQNKFKSF